MDFSLSNMNVQALNPILDENLEMQQVLLLIMQADFVNQKCCFFWKALVTEYAEDTQPECGNAEIPNKVDLKASLRTGVFFLSATSNQQFSTFYALTQSPSE